MKEKKKEEKNTKGPEPGRAKKGELPAANNWDRDRS
jgi:hypothetical protein